MTFNDIRRPCAVVLGASTGVGADIVRKLIQNGYKVVGFHRGNHQEDADLLVEEHGSALQLMCMNAGASQEDVLKCVSMLPCVASVLVHSLSGAAVGSVLQTSEKQITQTFNNLAHSFLWWAQTLAACGYLAPEAKLIALSNPCPDFYLRNTGVIGAAKAALETYVKLLAVELGRYGHFVNCIRFSTVITPALKKVLGDSRTEYMTELHNTLVPRCRIMSHGDVSESVMGLVQSNWMNGAIIDATGGATLTLMDHAFHGQVAQ